jgi:hypothetical protein
MNVDIDGLRYRVASLVVLAEGMSAAELRELIGLEPDRSWDLGDSIGRTARGRRHSTGWCIDAAGVDMPPESAIADLLDRISIVEGRIRAAAADPRVRSVALWVWPGEHDSAVDLVPACLMKVARLDASLIIDMYDREEREE